MDYGLFLISSGINGWKLKHLNDRFAYTCAVLSDVN